MQSRAYQNIGKIGFKSLIDRLLRYSDIFLGGRKDTVGLAVRARDVGAARPDVVQGEADPPRRL